MDRKILGVQIPIYLDEWLNKKAEETFGRKRAKSDFIRFILKEIYEKEQKNKK